MRQWSSSFQSHLTITEISLPPAGEWTPESPGWILLQITGGTAYWLNAIDTRELPIGSVLLISPEAKGCVRASQLGKLTARFFFTEPGSLVGLMTLGEQEFFRRAAAQDEFSARILPPGDPISEKFLRLREDDSECGFSIRAILLQLFSEIFGAELKRLRTNPSAASGAKERLTELLLQTPAAELLDLPFSDLVQKAKCTPRHLSRIFREALGMSFREKQTEIRLTRARELLATTGYKVVDVALESGYQSLSLFNLMFKRRFGMSPGRWREQVRTRRACQKSLHRTNARRMTAAVPVPV